MIVLFRIKFSKNKPEKKTIIINQISFFREGFLNIICSKFYRKNKTFLKHIAFITLNNNVTCVFLLMFKIFFHFIQKIKNLIFDFFNLNLLLHNINKESIEKVFFFFAFHFKYLNRIKIEDFTFFELFKKKKKEHKPIIMSILL